MTLKEYKQKLIKRLEKNRMEFRSDMTFNKDVVYGYNFGIDRAIELIRKEKI